MSVPSWTPHPWQTAAVAAYFDHGGLFCGLDPGAGKTYVAAMIAARCVRPLVLAPASVIPQTMVMFRARGVECGEVKHWDWRNIGPGKTKVAFASYTWLQQAGQQDFFQRFRPTDVLPDEFHLIRNLSTNSAGKRLNRYLVDDWSVRVGVFTGSPWGTKLEDMAHGLRFALRKRAPVPPTRDGVAMLSERLERDPAARAEWYARLQATPGVFLDSDGAGVYAGRVELRVIRREPALVLPDTWALPDGWLLGSAAEAAGAARNLAWGFWPKRSPRPTPAFLEARRAWAAVVRRVTERGACDTESQVRELRPADWAEYKGVADQQPPYREEAVWEQPRYVNETLSALTIRRGTIVWANSVALQERVATVLGCPWHHERGLDAEGVRIDETRAPVVVASMKACHAGFNCQQFNHNIVLEPSADQELTKQLVARTARQGQEQPWVTVDLVVNSYVVENALRQSIVRARVAYEATGKKNPLLQLEGREF